MKSILFKTYATLFMICISFSTFADQTNPYDPPGDEDPNPAPINTKLIWLAVVGVLFMFFYFKNLKKQNVAN